MLNRSFFVLLAVTAAAALVSGCDTVQLLAPTNSTVTVTAPTRVLQIGGSTEVTAVVLESAGTPVQNGTTVRFTTTLGRVEPAEAQTRNGMAVTTFYAGDASGVADIRATSGAAGGSAAAGGAAGAAGTSSNVVQVSVGAAAVDSVTVQANPSVVSANGGSVTVVATVQGAGGRALPGVHVTFSTTAGSLNPTQGTTDANGQATTRLTTTATATVTASAGGKASASGATVTAQPGPALTIACAVGATTNCLSVVAGQTAGITVQRAASTSAIQLATLTFGDGSAAVELGLLVSPVTIPHVYNDPGSYTVRVTATDINGESVTVSQFVQVLAVVSGGITVETVEGRTVRATANVEGARVVSYVWTFDTSVTLTTTTNLATYTYPLAESGKPKIISVRATLADGRPDVTLSTSIVVP